MIPTALEALKEITKLVREGNEVALFHKQEEYADALDATVQLLTAVVSPPESTAERIFEAVVHTYEGDDHMVPEDLREASFVRRARRFRESQGAVVSSPESAKQNEDAPVVAAITAIVREADAAFQRSGGSSRHWVRECFLPELNLRGWVVMQTEPCLCQHCGEALRKDADGNWIDAETHTVCVEGGRKHEAVSSKGGAVVSPSGRAQEVEHRCGVRGFAESGDECPGCIASGRFSAPPSRVEEISADELERRPELSLVEAMIRNRIDTSEQAAIEAARAKDKSLVDYHAGCIGMGLCLLADIEGLR